MVTDHVPTRDGIDKLSNIEHLSFSDRSLELTMASKLTTVCSSDVNALIELYVAYFNRVPGASGLSYWVGQLSGGQSLSQISEQFYSAGVQFSSITGYPAGMSSADFIKLAYANTLGRSGSNAPSASDVAYWDNQISTGAVSKGGLIQTMLGAAHQYAGDPTWGWVPQLLDNKLALGSYHAIQFGIDYATANEEITATAALAAAVTPSSIAAAVGLIGLADNVHLV